jgi:hypothetical protein
VRALGGVQGAGAEDGVGGRGDSHPPSLVLWWTRGVMEAKTRIAADDPCRIQIPSTCKSGL